MSDMIKILFNYKINDVSVIEETSEYLFEELKDSKICNVEYGKKTIDDGKSEMNIDWTSILAFISTVESIKTIIEIIYHFTKRRRKKEFFDLKIIFGKKEITFNDVSEEEKEKIIKILENKWESEE